MVRADPISRRLMTVPGVGKAGFIILTISRMKRSFPRVLAPIWRGGHCRGTASVRPRSRADRTAAGRHAAATANLDAEDQAAKMAIAELPTLPLAWRARLKAFPWPVGDESVDPCQVQGSRRTQETDQSDPSANREELRRALVGQPALVH